MSPTTPFVVSGARGRWLTAIGIVFVILGILAIVEPAVAGLAVAILVGWFLLFGGVAHAIAAFGGGAGRTIWQLVVAVIYFVGGAYFLTHPLLGLGSLTLFLAAILVVEALMEVGAYFAARGKDGASGWQLVNAGVTLFLGALIWVNWPSSSVWAIGTLVGVNLLMTGFSRLMLGSAARKMAGAIGA